MRFRNLRKWENPNQCEGLLFFAQRMEELLFDYSLDSYKPPALNSLFLCKEALSLIEDIENRIIDPENLVPVLEELDWSLKNDRVAKSLLDAEPEKYILLDEATQLKDKKIRLEVLARTLGVQRYVDRCSELLALAIQEKSKIEISKLSTLLTTTLLNCGLSKQYLYTKTLDYFYIGSTPKITGNDNIKEFLESIYPIGHEFEVYFTCSRLIAEVRDSISAFNVIILDELPEDLHEISDQQGFKKSDDEVYVEVSEIQCADVFTARELAERRLDQLRDLFTLFNHKNQISWNEKALIKQCCVEGPKCVLPPKSAMEKGFDMKPEMASRELNRLIKQVSLSDSSLEKFNRVVDFHGIGVTNDVPENQLLNIWIAPTPNLKPRIGELKVEPAVPCSVFWRPTSRPSMMPSRSGARPRRGGPEGRGRSAATASLAIMF